MMSKIMLRWAEKVNVEAGSDGCWLWTGATKPNGYGHMNVGGKTTHAHRLAWELFRFPIPKGMHVLHSCDVRACVNPQHHFLGTQLDNMLDMLAKGRDGHGRFPGEANYNAKLTQVQVDEIRQRRDGGERVVDLAQEFGVCRNTITNIHKHHNWAHVT